MVETKHLPAEVADTIGKYVNRKGAPRDMLAELRAEGDG